MSDEYKKFLNWCEDKWTQEHKMQKLLSKLSNDDIDFLKDQYETRLKADMVEMLEEISLEIDEMDTPQFSPDGMNGFYWEQELVKDLVQQKINALKAESEDNNVQTM